MSERKIICFIILIYRKNPSVFESTTKIFRLDPLFFILLTTSLDFSRSIFTPFTSMIRSPTFIPIKKTQVFELIITEFISDLSYLSTQHNQVRQINIQSGLSIQYNQARQFNSILSGSSI